MLAIKLLPPAFGFATAAAAASAGAGISLCFILLYPYLAFATPPPLSTAYSTAYLPTVIILVVALNQSVVAKRPKAAKFIAIDCYGLVLVLHNNYLARPI